MAAGDTVRLSSMVQRTIVLVTAFAMLLFAVPLAVVVGGLYRGEAQEHLARDAERARSVLTPPVLAQPALISAVLPAPHETTVRVGVYDGTGRRIAGAGPARSDAITGRVSASGVEESARLGAELVTVVPLAEDVDAPAAYVVRAAEPYDQVQRIVWLTWALMAALGLAVLGLAAALARRQARRLAQPLQQLAASAAALGQGDFSVRPNRSRVREVDDAGRNLELTARRLGGVLERERAFSADASHQLRGPLTAVRIGLEAALLTPGADLRASAQDALSDLDRLERTVLDLLALARDTRRATECIDVRALVSDVVQPWSRRLAESGRTLTMTLDDALPSALGSPPALRTVMDVLLGNALTHGAGAVRVAVRSDDQTVIVEVADQGPGLPEPTRGGAEVIFTRRSPEAKGTGIGLSLARSLIEADGGRLEVTSRRPAVFAVLLPAVSPPTGDLAGRSGSRSSVG